MPCSTKVPPVSVAACSTVVLVMGLVTLRVV
jgi:hypothetical protein